MIDSFNNDPHANESSAEMSAEMLERASGMTPALREELLSEKRLGRSGRADVSPAIYVGAAEGPAIFRGLNGTRQLLGPLEKALEIIGKDPVKAAEAYELQVEKLRSEAEAKHDPNTTGA